MPDLSTIFRDFGTVPTLVCIGVFALLGYSILKGGSKGGNNKKGGSGNSAPPTA